MIPRWSEIGERLAQLDLEAESEMLYCFSAAFNPCNVGCDITAVETEVVFRSPWRSRLGNGSRFRWAPNIRSG